jgi:predicted nucleic acid-binding protein
VNVAIDTNVLAYAEGLNGAAKKDVALDVIERLLPEATFVPVQVLGELFTVLVRKARRPPAVAAAAVQSWGDVFPLIESSADVLLAATSLADAHALGISDAIILSAASEARCRLLLSEDLQDGFTWRGVTVVNPFSSARHPLLAALLADAAPPDSRKSRAGHGKRTIRSARRSAR